MTIAQYYLNSISVDISNRYVKFSVAQGLGPKKKDSREIVAREFGKYPIKKGLLV